MNLPELVGQACGFLVAAGTFAVPFYLKLRKELGSSGGSGDPSLRDLVMQLHGRFDEMDKRVTKLEDRSNGQPPDYSWLDDERPGSPSPRAEPPR